MKKRREKHFFKSLLAIFIPWVVMLIYGNIGAAAITLILQVTVIGWIPAAIWAWRTVHGTVHQSSKEFENPAP